MLERAAVWGVRRSLIGVRCRFVEVGCASEAELHSLVLGHFTRTELDEVPNQSPCT